MKKPDSTLWMEEARCRSLSYEDRNPYLYPLEKHNAKTKAFIAEFCGGCPVQETCLNYAIKNRIGIERDIQTHIWGGLDYRGRIAYSRNKIYEQRKVAGR